MELMCHSDRKLTDRLYTDTNLLPTAQVVRNLHEDENLIKILTNISGKTGQNGSKSVKNGLVKTGSKNRLEPVSLQGLMPKRVFETLVEVAGIEPAGAVGSTPASKRNLAHSPEALIKILTNLTKADRYTWGTYLQRNGLNSRVEWILCVTQIGS